MSFVDKSKGGYVGGKIVRFSKRKLQV